jgi:hypothetical protein
MTRTCPVCKGTAAKDGNKFWPLCSERCHLIDLGKWLGEEYRVAGEPDPDLMSASPPTGEGEDEGGR